MACASVQWIMLPFSALSNLLSRSLELRKLILDSRAANSFLYIPAVPLALASRVLHYLNIVGEHGLVSSSPSVPEAPPHRLAGPDARAARDAAALEHAHRRSLLTQSTAFEREQEQDDGKWRMKRRTEGYVTPDSCGVESDDPSEVLGDDTLHRPFRSSLQPIFVSTALPQHEEKIDVVFFDFITPDVLGALNVLGAAGKGGKKYGARDVEVYMRNLTANTLMEEYAKREWN